MVKRQKKKKSSGVAEMLLLFLALCLELLTSQTLLGLRMRAHSKLPPIQETVSSPSHNSNMSPIRPCDVRQEEVGREGAPSLPWFAPPPAHFGFLTRFAVGNALDGKGRKEGAKWDRFFSIRSEINPSRHFRSSTFSSAMPPPPPLP